MYEARYPPAARVILLSILCFLRYFIKSSFQISIIPTYINPSSLCVIVMLCLVPPQPHKSIRMYMYMYKQNSGQPKQIKTDN